MIGITRRCGWLLLAGTLLAHADTKPEPDLSASDPTVSEAAAPPPAPAAAPAAPPTEEAPATTPQELEPRVLAIFEKHCAKCHGSDSEGKGGFDKVLDLEYLKRAPQYIRPGQPGESELYRRITSGEMPEDASYGLADAVSYPDQALLKQWIESLTAAPQTLAADRQFIDLRRVSEWLLRDLAAIDPLDRPAIRYFSLVNLYNSNVSAEELTLYLQGFSKLINSLSKGARIVQPLAVDDIGGVVVRINLNDIAWGERQWDALIAAYPYGLKYFDQPLLQAVIDQTATPVPVVRADWFVFQASRPPLYYQLLELPDQLAALERQLGVDVAANIARGLAKRAGFQDSGVSQNNRLIERHDLPSGGAYWRSYDFGGNKARQSLFKFPLGPGGELAFQADGGEVIFNLPNGLQAYYLTNGAGRRLDKGPTDIVQDANRRDGTIIAGVSCMSCHASGMIKKADAIRPYVEKSPDFSLAVVDQVRRLYPPASALEVLLESDRQRFLGAAHAAGAGQKLASGEYAPLFAALGKNTQQELVVFLSDRYEQPLALLHALAEFELTPEQFQNALLRAGQTARALEARLQTGMVPRDQFETEFVAVVEEFTRNQPLYGGAVQVTQQARPDYAVPAAAQKPLPPAPFKLTLTLPKTVYRIGELLQFSVTSERDCNLFVVGIDAEQRATLLFPNQYEPRNAVRAGQTLTIPSLDAQFDLEIAGPPGTDQLIALCNVQQANALNQALAYSDENPFADLGAAERFTKAVTVKHRARREVEVLTGARFTVEP